MSTFVRSEVANGVARLTLNDEATRNSLSEAMMQALIDALAACSENTSIGAVIIASQGKVFSSGHNLKELTAHRSDGDAGLAYFEKTFGLCAKLMLAISHHRCAVIAEVDGLASAAGCQLVAACDLAYASEPCPLLYAWRKHRALLLNSHGAALSQLVAKACARNVAVGRCSRCSIRRQGWIGQCRCGAK